MAWGKDKNACKFEGCSKVKGEGGFCPRHTLMVSMLGEDGAMDMEYGFLCRECVVRREDKPQKCQTCEAMRCLACAEEQKCCVR
jgi:hypothetical protein